MTTEAAAEQAPGLVNLLDRVGGAGFVQKSVEAIRQVGNQDSDAGAPAPEVSQHDAVFEAAYLTAAADGQLTDEEVEQLAASIEQLLGTKVTDEELENLFDTYYQRLQAEGIEPRLAAVCSALRGTQTAQAAYAFSAGVAYIGEMGEEEDDMLSSMAESLGLEPSEVEQLDRQVRAQLGIPEPS